MVQYRWQLGSVRAYRGAQGRGRERGRGLRKRPDARGHQHGRRRRVVAARRRQLRLGLRQRGRSGRGHPIGQILCGHRHPRGFQRRHDDVVFARRHAFGDHLLHQREGKPHRTAHHGERRCFGAGFRAREVHRDGGQGGSVPCERPRVLSRRRSGLHLCGAHGRAYGRCGPRHAFGRGRHARVLVPHDGGIRPVRCIGLDAFIVEGRLVGRRFLHHGCGIRLVRCVGFVRRGDRSGAGRPGAEPRGLRRLGRRGDFRARRRPGPIKRCFGDPAFRRAGGGGFSRRL